MDNVLWEVDLHIPIGNIEGDDKLIWHYSSNGEYNVKSGYFLTLGNGETNSQGVQCGFTKGLRKLWKLKIPNKIKIHVWRILFNALPCRQNLLHRGVQMDVTCPTCLSYHEDISNAFWLCKATRNIWKNSVLWPILRTFKGFFFFGYLFN